MELTISASFQLQGRTAGRHLLSLLENSSFWSRGRRLRSRAAPRQNPMELTISASFQLQGRTAGRHLLSPLEK